MRLARPFTRSESDDGRDDGHDPDRSRTAMAEFWPGHEVCGLGETYLEVLSPLQGEAESTAARFLRRNGGMAATCRSTGPRTRFHARRMAAFASARCCATPTRGAPSPSTTARLLHPLEVDQVDARRTGTGTVTSPTASVTARCSESWLSRSSQPTRRRWRGDGRRSSSSSSTAPWS